MSSQQRAVFKNSSGGRTHTHSKLTMHILCVIILVHVSQIDSHKAMFSPEFENTTADPNSIRTLNNILESINESKF